MTIITHLSVLKWTKHFIPAHSGFPNTSLNPSFPLIIYRSVFPSSTPSADVSSHLRQTGVVEPQWTYPMYTQHHYHSTTHELLVVVAGSANVCFGGPANPQRVCTRVEKGDAMLVPAGVAHGMQTDLGGFMMLGSYPVGAAQWDHCTGKEGKESEARIRRLEWFARDPIYGDQGPAVDAVT